MRRAYSAETAVMTGCACVQGSDETRVKAPGAAGAGSFVGIYPAEDNRDATPGEMLAIALDGVAKARAGAVVTAGKMAVIKDASGVLINAPTVPGTYPIVGMFLQSGGVGDFVDCIIARSTLTITA